MGSDDLFKRAKARKQKGLVRESNKKEPYDKFLIVSEDTKSSTIYLEEAVAYYRIQSANFAIIGLGKDPLDVVCEAEKLYSSELKSHKPDYDKVFCVFDRDAHTRYYNALQKIESLNKKHISKTELPIFNAITSNPCFELWIYLHFKYTTKSFTPTQKKSIGEKMISELLSVYPEYAKNSKGYFTELFPRLNPTAISNAEKLLAHREETGSETHTKVVTLIKYIQDLKNQKPQ
ncbi:MULTISPECIES: RloB family protein [unclassified Salinivibrio]|uniref:RloB family protein n=1 Tax=unclassified Salinivibrio TaxID=2636825 RepID=UPI00128CB215|nr:MULTISPECIES: RloB family protein [unclassified Salinivibrio]MPS31894.1 RloB domain-containing protein [Salinivibrio sp. VYel7]MPX93288.1 RloB domain-containing protein [Salinivibrio sp. VYel9]MPX95885.1 RloB domain-containing protein [Salinivibrio sp. VYel6]MPX99506.1 RloB domain-containing protein [Salinivibrio sp. VYel4]MPY02645.1 RloB domain-containing protein [Salinivibrio sp. VYel5]